MAMIINHLKKGKRVNKYSFIGSILLISTFLMFAYQVITAFLGMGTSDEFVYAVLQKAPVILKFVRI
jgi:hypothetical protein